MIPDQERKKNLIAVRVKDDEMEDLQKIADRDSREPGLQRIRQAWREISDRWSEIETSGGSLAWEWILRGSPHGAKIQAAQRQVDAIGSGGNPAELVAACVVLVAEWREAIEAWKKANGETKAEQGSFNLGQHRAKAKESA